MSQRHARRRLVPYVMAAVLSLGVGSPVLAQAEEEAFAALSAGEYDAAIRQLQRLAATRDATVRAHQGLVRALSEVGRYEEAERAARAGVAEKGSALANTLGEVLVLRGGYDEAETSFSEAMGAGSDDQVSARLNLALLQFRTGRRDEAMAAFDGFIDLYNQTPGLSSTELTAVGIAVRHLGIEDSDLLQDALRAFDEALAKDPSDPEPSLWTGQLFLDTYRSPDARESLQLVLNANPRHPEAILGMARALEFDGSPEAMGEVRESLEVNPNLVPALVMLSRLHVGLEDYDAAEEEARKALAVNPVSLEALSVLAATHYLSGDLGRFEAAKQQVVALNPSYADLHNTVAELAVQNRRYADAVELSAEAVRIDPSSWRGRGVLGINRLRVGQIEEGRAELERAFEGDPFNPWFKNTLDLLDTFERYEVAETEHFRIAIDGRESDLLAPYVSELAEEAFRSLAERYDYEPPTPIRLELFPSHADFSVRTVGLAGLGALGVSFGNVVAMDSPSARNPGEFNWASTLWHEMAHVFHLGLSDHRMPRWLGEGLAVFEQRRGQDAWGHDVDPGFLVAYHQDRILPVSQLNSGFVRPSYAEQVVYSYYQASLVCELIARDYGFPALVRMLREYGTGATTEQVFERVLGTDLETFDDTFVDYFEERFRGPLAAVRQMAEGAAAGRGRGSAEDVARLATTYPGDFASQLAMGLHLFNEGQLDEAERYLVRAKGLFPEYAGADSPAWFLAQIYEQRGDTGRAIAELETVTGINESFLEANLEEARLKESSGDLSGALEAMDRSIQVYPYTVEFHDRLAELAAGLNRAQMVVRERQALVSLDPVDMAQALYRLALAHYDAGEPAQARRVVLRALERAPNYEEAQDLLLRIRGSTDAPPPPNGSCEVGHVGTGPP